jgi:hypothetical protein
MRLSRRSLMSLGVEGSRFRVQVAGRPLMSRKRHAARLPAMPLFLLHHQHAPAECAAAFAAWLGFDSPLRGGAAASTCLEGGHALWWRVEATDRQAALALLPHYVAHRTDVIPVRDIHIP